MKNEGCGFIIMLVCIVLGIVILLPPQLVSVVVGPLGISLLLGVVFSRFFLTRGHSAEQEDLPSVPVEVRENPQTHTTTTSVSLKAGEIEFFPLRFLGHFVIWFVVLCGGFALLALLSTLAGY